MIGFNRGDNALYVQKEKSLRYLENRGHGALSHSSSIPKDLYNKATEKINNFLNKATEDDNQIIRYLAS